MLKRVVSTVNRRAAAFSLSVAALLTSCVPPALVTTPPAPQTKQEHGPDSTPAPTQDTAHSIDFGDAFEAPDSSAALPDSSIRIPLAPQIANIPVESLRFPSFAVGCSMVRVALRQNTTRLVAYSAGPVTLRHRHAPRRAQSFRGRLLFQAKPGNRGASVTVGNHSLDVTLPCTLQSDNQYGFIEIGDTTYRGALILAAGKPGAFSVINYLDVEEYLRGVVPLEMGKRSREELEALKAQAVAARTYTYRRITERVAESFDLLPTVADQVYGGASVEYREADVAVAATGNLIMVAGDSIIMAYYHSTCGGVTADVFEAWGKPPRSYLRPIVDADPAGKAWCRASAYFTWEETWPWKQFSAIVVESLRKTFPQQQFKGVVNSLAIDERFSCGRVRRATITGSGWLQEVGGDQIRFILRRGTGGNPILRSSSFNDVSTDRAVIKLSGKGYGHGVGMCQMGAVGRAQAGQNFVTILKSYYTGISIVTAVVDKRAGK